MTESKDEILIAGGGLTGLSAGYLLTKAGRKVQVFEADSAVGGISKTIEHRGFRFDLGGHRFFSLDKRINEFVKDLMDGELLSVPRTSKIFMRGRYFNYPLKPVNAVFGMGISTTVKILSNYGIEKIRGIRKKPVPISLEDWVVANFGRTMFNIYFKGYSEKVWGIDCSRISAQWVAQRIRGLSLAKAVANALFKGVGKKLPTLVDTFQYPRLGIGRMSEKLREGIEKTNQVHTETSVEGIKHNGARIESITVRQRGASSTKEGKEFISSMPITHLVRMLNPSPPDAVLEAAAKLRFRDLVIVALMIDKRRVTDQTWIYIPEQKIPFGRIHEPTNWSEHMAPPGKTLLVLEFFSFQGDAIWNMDDSELVEMSIRHLEQLKFIKHHEVLDSTVVRVPKAYPLFEVGYADHFNRIFDYLSTFENLHIAGRGGMFRYYNMDHALESGMAAADKILSRNQ